MVIYGFLSVWDTYMSALYSSILSPHLFSYIHLFSQSTPLPISFPPVAMPQTSCASTASSIMRTCRRSPSTLWFVMLMPQDSRLERHSCHRGKTPPPHTHKEITMENKQTSIHILRLCWVFWDIEVTCPHRYQYPTMDQLAGMLPTVVQHFGLVEFTLIQHLILFPKYKLYKKHLHLFQLIRCFIDIVLCFCFNVSFFQSFRKMWKSQQPATKH